MMVNVALLPALILAPTAIFATPTFRTLGFEERDLQKRCGVDVGVAYFSGSNCEAETQLAGLTWSSWYSQEEGYNYQLDNSRSYRIIDSHNTKAKCILMGGPNMSGTILGYLEYDNGYSPCFVPGDGSQVQSFACWNPDDISDEWGTC